MKREYTDSRFPGVTVANDDKSRVFEVRRNGKLLMTYESWDRPDGTIGESAAAARAADFFNRNAEPPAKIFAENISSVPDDRDITDIVNVPPSAAHNSRVIDRMIEREKHETDPAAKARLRHNIMHLMKQEESVAEAVVSHLIAT